MTYSNKGEKTRRYYLVAIIALGVAASFCITRSPAQDASSQQSVGTGAGQKSNETPKTPPSLTSLLTQTVVFIYEDKTPANTNAPVTGKVLGTAFIVGVPLPGQPDRSVPFVVTAKHVLADQSKVLVRFTLTSGNQPGFAEYDLDQLRRTGDLWSPSDEGVDLVVFRTPVYDKARFLSFPLDMIASKDTFGTEFINVSDRVMIPCLMSRFPGVAQNYPIFRDGSIALIAEEPISFSWTLGSNPINTSQKVIFINAVLNEGFSGAPVFLWPGMRLTPHGNMIGGKPWLIGIVHGFFPEFRKVIDGDGMDVVVSKQQPGLLGQLGPPRQVSVYSQENSATGVVFGAWHLADIIQQEQFKKRLQQLADEESKAKQSKK